MVSRTVARRLIGALVGIGLLVGLVGSGGAAPYQPQQGFSHPNLPQLQQGNIKP